MAKKKVNKQPEVDLDALYRKYDQARLAATEAEAEKKEAGDAIREVLGETQEASTPEYTCTFKYDKDKDVFDPEKFEKKDPKGYAKYCASLEAIELAEAMYTKKEKGVRKLVIVRKEQE